MKVEHSLPPDLPARTRAPIFAGEASVWIDAPPLEVYALVSDLKRMGEFSPECFRVEWLEGATGPEVGVQARGWNRFWGVTWARRVVCLTTEPGQEFTFQTIPEGIFYQDSTIWSYRFDAQDGGTRLTESYAIIYLSPWMHLFELVSGRPKLAVPGLQATLNRIKATVEQSRVDQRGSS
jgi:hypothetical protein